MHHAQVVSCDMDKLEHHRAAAEPPKIKFQTCLELRGLLVERLQALCPS